MQVEKVRSPRDLRAFVDLPRELMGGDPAFVPPLTSEGVKRLDPRQNPFFRHAEAGFWLCRRGDRRVGRISAVSDRLAQDFHGLGQGIFGHFLAEDREAAALLLAEARSFLRSRGLDSMLGPIELSTNYTCGLQVDRFDLPPTMEMNQHPEGQEELLLREGLVKAKDLLAFRIQVDDLKTERIERISEISARRSPFRIRPFRQRDFDREVETLHRVYEKAWERNFAFVPMSREEFFASARGFRKILVPGLCLLAEDEEGGKGFILALPDINQAILACGGRLFPFGWWKFFLALKRCSRVRVLTLGLVPEARGRGLDARLIIEVIRASRRKGYRACEVGWVLEDNLPMLGPIRELGLLEGTRYRLYQGSTRAG